jgi:hypothetical protein
MTIETAPPSGVVQVPDDEWFGEGSAFDSGEDLAAALFALAGVTHRREPPDAEVSPPPPPLPPVESAFFEVERPAALESARRPYASRGRTTPSSASPRSWSVRTPGDALLPPTLSGRSGWTIRNSVTVLHRTEEAIARLREDAVAMAFLAASEACGRGRPRSLERRSHPR